jgi:hypothetical protein
MKREFPVSIVALRIFADGIQRANVGQHNQLGTPQSRHAARKIGDGSIGSAIAFFDNGMGNVGAKSADVVEAKAND